MDYLSTDDHWYSEKGLCEKTKLGDLKPNFNTAALTSHIDKTFKMSLKMENTIVKINILLKITIGVILKLSI